MSRSPKTQSPQANRASAQPAGDALPQKSPSIGKYLIDRMWGRGIRTVFGIPGDYVLGFYEQLCESPIRVIGTTREDCAGYAADAYARINGIGALCVTYCVGGLSVVNSVAGAYAEKSPLLVITGSPGLSERGRNALLHHKVRDFHTQKDVFDKITVASAVLEDPVTAFREIDRVLDAIDRYKRPGYLEIPRDCVHLRSPFEHHRLEPKYESDPKELAEAIRETIERLQNSKNPVLLVGVEVHRFGLQDLVVQLAEKHKIPICTTILGKSVVSEGHPLYVGIYEGAMGRETPRRLVEESDCCVMLGTFLTDINMGIHTANLDPSRCILVTSEDCRISYHHYPNIVFEEFTRSLLAADFTCSTQEVPITYHNPAPFTPKSNTPITMSRLFEKINTILTEDMVVICDVGDSLFAGADLLMRRRTEFLSPAYYTSMGFSVPAALGAQCADPKGRPIVLVGDGAFQMTGLELSTIYRQGLNPIVIVLNNKGYMTERFIKDGSFNDIGDWHYHKITELIGGGWGFEVRSETDLEKAIDAAIANNDSFSLLNVHLGQYDRSDALGRLTERLADSLRIASDEK